MGRSLSKCSLFGLSSTVLPRDETGLDSSLASSRSLILLSLLRLLKYSGRFFISLATIVGGNLLILLPFGASSSNFFANRRECMANASSGDSAGGISPVRGDGRFAWLPNILGGSKASSRSRPRFRLAGRGAIV